MWEVVKEIQRVKGLESRLKKTTTPDRKKSLETELSKAVAEIKPKQKTKKTDSEHLFERFKNVVLETYERSKLLQQAMSVVYQPPVIEAYSDKDYKKQEVKTEKKKSFDQEQLMNIQKEGKLDALHLTPWKVNERAFAFKFQHYNEYELWKLITPAGQSLAFIAYELA